MYGYLIRKTGTGSISYSNNHLHDLGGNKTTNYDKLSLDALNSVPLKGSKKIPVESHLQIIHRESV